jgi:hypothetical protein
MDWAGSTSVLSAAATAQYVPFPLTVSAVDGHEFIDKSYRGTITFSSSDPNAVLPESYTFTVADAGAHTFMVTLDTTGDQTISFNDTATASMAGNIPIHVYPGNPPPSPPPGGQTNPQPPSALPPISTGAPPGLAGSTLPLPPHLIATGAAPGGSPLVQVFDATTHALKSSFLAYDPHFTGGVRVAVGMMNGAPVIITAPGPGGGPDVHVYDENGQLLRQFWAFDPAFTGGVFVAAGDVNGDGNSDVIVGADAGGGPHVRALSGTDDSVLDSFFAFDPAFTGGVRVAAGDFLDDGHADIIAGAGPGGGPDVATFDGRSGALLHSFFAFNPAFTGGVYVTAAVDAGNATSDVIAAAGAGGGPDVAVFRGADLTPLNNFFAAAPNVTGGVPVAAIQTATGKAAVVTGPGTNSGQVTALDPLSGATVDAFFTQSQGGMFIAANPA